MESRDDTSVAESRPVSPVRILLADDHEAILTRVIEVLAPHYDVIRVVRDGAALVEKAASLDPDVLVVDICMPILDGIQAVDRLRNGGSRAKVVFLTVNEGADFVQACFAAGANGYVVKSRLANDLVFAIREALVGRRFVSPTL